MWLRGHTFGLLLVDALSRVQLSSHSSPLDLNSELVVSSVVVSFSFTESVHPLLLSVT